MLNTIKESQQNKSHKKQYVVISMSISISISSYSNDLQLRCFDIHFDSPFHILTATPRSISMSMTRPKLSVIAASLLSGDNTICSPARRLSGKPNLSKNHVFVMAG